MTACPLGDELTNGIEADDVTAKEDPKSRHRKLADKYGWDVNEAKKIWCFGPETSGPNLLVDMTKAV
jgi:elongation factor 2